ncbi:MAG: helix-turn-helix transcriptional regulator [Saprospiraceae bacterium]|nr:helix-turn-helix transcriptional regulator [Saprospiraceae bacterium]MBK9686531.1 helix-turn-helix transcriptional regulator [Saprospiraceae bacterium]
MDILTNGTYFGQNDFTYQKGGIHLTETVYTHPRVDWHFHENAYITLLLNGGMREGNKKEEYQCVPGTILYHHWQDAHYNIKEPRFTKGFHIEISSGLFNKWDYDRGKKEGSYRLMHPEAKLLIYKLLYELKGDDEISDLAIESLVTHLFSVIHDNPSAIKEKQPAWVRQVEMLLHDPVAGPITLEGLASAVDRHPVYISRTFHQYFGCHLGDYLRWIKLGRVLETMSNKKVSLSSLAHEAGFADQSHFIKNFKSYFPLNPSKFRKGINRSFSKVNTIQF